MENCEHVLVAILQCLIYKENNVSIKLLQTLKILHHSPEFLPYVIFVSAPSVHAMKNLGDQHSHQTELLSSVSLIF